MTRHLSHKAKLAIIVLLISVSTVFILKNRRGEYSNENLTLSKQSAERKARTPAHGKRATFENALSYQKSLDSDAFKVIQDSILNANSTEELIAMINSLENPNDSLAIIGPLFAKLAKEDIELAFSYSKLLTNQKVEKWSRACIIATVAESDPENAIKLARTRDPDSLSLHMENIFRLWATKDPEMALKSWAQISTSEKLSSGKLIIETWAARDPKSLLQFYNANRNFDLSKDAVFFALKELATKDMAYALGYLDKSNIGETKLDLLKMIVSQSNTKESSSLLVSWISANTSGEMKASLMKAIIPKVGKYDLSLAISMIGDIPSEDGRGFIISNLIADRFDSSIPLSSLELLTGFGDKHDRDLALDAIFVKWAQSDPLAALKFSIASTNENEKSATAKILNTWAAKDPFAVIEWINNGENFSNLTGSGLDISYIIGKAAALDPKKAATLIASQNSLQAPDSFEAMERVTYHWAKKDPEAAAIWLKSNSNSPAERTRLYTVFVGSWMGYDSLSASKWVSGMSPGAEKDGAIVALVEGAAGHEPEIAYGWALEIENQKLRERMINSIPAIK